ncbi:high-affinity choline transporter BetT, partial [Burkholderia multivorans]
RVARNTKFLLNAFVLNVADFFRLFPNMVGQTFAFEDTGTWMTDWTLFFWAWWIAWASFVGLFLARISRGRTIRQFVIGTLTIPFIYIFMWISIYGN